MRCYMRRGYGNGRANRGSAMSIGKIWLAVICASGIADAAAVAVSRDIALPPLSALTISILILCPINAAAFIYSLRARKNAAGNWAGSPQAAGVSVLIMMCGLILSLSIVPTNMVLHLDRNEWHRVAPLLPRLHAVATHAYRAAISNHGHYPEQLQFAVGLANRATSGTAAPHRASPVQVVNLIRRLRMVYVGGGIKTRMLGSFIPGETAIADANWNPHTAARSLALLVGRAVPDECWGSAHYVLMACGEVAMIPQAEWGDFLRRQNRLRAGLDLKPVALARR